MSDYKVGDKVIRVSDSLGSKGHLKIGEIYVVTQVGLSGMRLAVDRCEKDGCDCVGRTWLARHFHPYFEPVVISDDEKSTAISLPSTDELSRFMGI